jgi:hypothetical protein
MILEVEDGVQRDRGHDVAVSIAQNERGRCAIFASAPHSSAQHEGPF